MKFPYGICDFYKIITEEYMYVDRTDRIPLIEGAGNQLLFLRPRRFGKSLLLSILRNYYDLVRADEFEKLFGHLAIGQDPTERHNQYFVLKWDFSAVSPLGEAHEIQQSLYNHINGCIEQFSVHYRDVLTYKIERDPHDALRSFQSVLAAVQQTPYKLYLLIDEYDNFANEVMMSGHSLSRKRYEDLLYGEGTLKTVFKAIKTASEGQGLDRVFITGVSPVVLSDITSGYNIAENIYLEPDFHDLCGFWESEIADMLRQVVAACQLPEEKVTEALMMMRKLYNGYRFPHEPAANQDAASEALLYNPTLAFYFIKHFQRHCRYPRNVLDTNLATDQEKIEYVSRLPGGEQIIADALNEEHPLSIEQLAHRFGIKEMLQVTEDRTFSASLLYYLGVLTLGGQTAYGELILKIPNLVIRKLYVERIQRMFLPDFTGKDAGHKAAQSLYQTGDMQPLCDFVEQHYFNVFDNRDYRWANELTVKTAFLTLLFNDTFYIVDSEPALDRRYADLTMILRPDMRQYTLLDILIEFKYVSLKDVGLRGEQVNQVSRAELKALAPVQQKLAEAKASLNDYRHALETAYGDVLRLRTYSVVAVGFDRLVWEEMT